MPFAIGAALAMAMVGPAGAAPAAGSVGSVVPGFSAREDALALAQARERCAAADAVVDGLKRALAPGHLADLAPGAGSHALDELRSDYMDMQRRAAGYRATLGEQHPTLAATELMLSDLKGRILDETRRALAAAERDAAQARAALAPIERSLAARSRPAADTTGSVAVPARPRDPPVPAAARADDPDDAVSAAPQPESGHGSSLMSMARRAAVSAGVLLALTAALWSLVSLGRHRPRSVRAARPPAPSRRREPEMAAAPAVPPAGPVVASAVPSRAVAAPTVPILVRLPLPEDGAARAVAAAFARAPAGPMARAAASLHTTLEDACGGSAGRRMTVLVLCAEDVGAEQGTGAALALAIAASAKGRRVALMEARPTGYLRRTVVQAGAAPMLVTAGGAERTAYRVTDGGAVVMVLPSDAGEAETAVAASRRHATTRLGGLDVFDTVILVGEAAAALSRAADLALVVAGPATDPASIAVAAGPCLASGQLCGAFRVDPVAVDGASDASVRPAAAGRRRMAVPARTVAVPDPIGLRGTLDPASMRLVA